MAESNTVATCAEEKMMVEESSQSNGSVSNKESEEFMLEFDPRPQRTVKLNRRGFFLLNREDDKKSNETSPGTVNSCKHTYLKKSEVSHDRLKSPPSGQKVIKLMSKKNTVPETQNGLKRSSNNTTSNGMDCTTQESPPKKKHKPITWP